MPSSGPIENFVHQQNIERYRRLLQQPLDAQRRRTILDLLGRTQAVEREAQVKALQGFPCDSGASPSRIGRTVLAPHDPPLTKPQKPELCESRF